MKTSANSLNKKRLEELWNQDQPQAKNLKVSSEPNGILQRLIQFFVGGNELRIWQTHDRSGNNLWKAYDPVTGRHTSVDSEAEMRVWIEKHYYQ